MNKSAIVLAIGNGGICSAGIEISQYFSKITTPSKKTRTTMRVDRRLLHCTRTLSNVNPPQNGKRLDLPIPTAPEPSGGLATPTPQRISLNPKSWPVGKPRRWTDHPRKSLTNNPLSPDMPRLSADEAAAEVWRHALNRTSHRLGITHWAPVPNASIITTPTSSSASNLCQELSLVSWMGYLNRS